MEEGNFENPLEIPCDEAGKIMKLQAEEKSSYMEDQLLEAHLRKCSECRELEPEKEDKTEEEDR